MTKWFSLTEADAQFLASAPFVYSYTATLPQSADEVWAELNSDTPLSWCKLVAGAKFLTPRPFGVGTVREMVIVPKLARVKEHYFLWDEQPGVRYENAFYVESSTLPGLKKFAEGNLVEQTPEGARFTWTFAVEPLAPLKPGLKIGGFALGKAFQSLMADTEKHFNRK